MDASGAVIPGAEIVARNLSTNVVREVQTDAQGRYRVFPLNPGQYDVTASAGGFRSTIQPGIVIEVASTVKIDFTLEVGETSETVEVTAEAAMLQTQDASVGGNVSSQELARLPVNGRNYTRLILLMPGVSDISRSQSRGTLSGTQLSSVNGQRTQDNNYSVDGVDNNFQHMNSPGASPPMDSIHEFRVATNNSAEFGRSAGANVNVVIKSGSRDLHGSLYEYLRNDKLDANDFFANRAGRGKVPYRQNQYGVAIGGPVLLPKLYNGRDKTFWFFSWEGFRSRRGSTAISTTPIADQRTGDFSQQARQIFDPLTSTAAADGTITRDAFANNAIPTSRINPAITYYMDNIMPMPNRPGLVNNLINTASASNDRDVFVVRGDHYFGSRDNVFVRYLNQSAGVGNPNSNPNLFATERFDVESYSAGWNHVFGPTSVLEVKFGLNNPANPLNTQSRTIQREQLLANAGISMYQPDVLFSPLPAFTATGEFTMGGGGGFIIQDTIPQFIVNLSKVMGKHSLRMGYNFTPRYYSINASDPMNGSATFDQRLTSQSGIALSGHSTASMLLGYPMEVRRGSGTVFPHARVFASQTYIQDDWRVTSRLTLNLGLRYEYANPPYDRDNQLGNLWIRRDESTGAYTGTLLWASVNPLVDPVTGETNQPARQMGFGRSLQASDYNNFAPRIALAYQVTPKTVIRSGFGIFYNSTFVQELQDKRKFWPYLPNQVFNPNTGLQPDLAITGEGPSFNSTEAIGGWPQHPENRFPYSQQWNLFVQHQVMDDLTLDIGYVGSSNKKQIGYIPINAAPEPGPGALQPRRLMPDLGSMAGGSNRFSSNYHAMQIKAVKRYSSGLQFHGNYTWGRCMDEQSSLAETRTQNPYDLASDYSRCSYDLRHVFKFAYVYDLPFGRGRRFGGDWNALVNGVLGGWALEGITQIQSGAALNVRTGLDHANVGGRTVQRPDVLRDPNANAPHTAEQWFDTSAFVLPAPYTYGNAGAYIVNDAGRHNWDVAIQKQFAFRETHSLQVRAEMFNLANTVKMVPSATQTFSSSSFGAVTSGTSARQIQFGLRYRF
ncbi:MAG: carboxypeptidase regulatory-like domain-containing protein [Bryobacterales bacterium]|nr:carboxypeptidase regulatory-like domain-containing protein [Bryobacterales bacterium]